MEISINYSGPEDSPAYAPLMAIILVVCGLGLASSLFPIVNYIVSGIVVLALLIGIGHGIAYLRRESRLDREAMYGPITEEEKEHNVQS